MKFRLSLSISLIVIFYISCSGKDSKNNSKNNPETTINTLTTIQVGAERTTKYLSLLENKKVGIVANHTSMIKNTHLVDSLLKLGINVKRVFSPEHGFRGTADAGEKVNSDRDSKTGLPIVSLYGKNKKPFPEQVNDLDIIIFDIQDVGARFYTYISTMHYVMESCAENNVGFMVLDRPNPNGHFVDGPTLEREHSSFIGMHPVPIVHGMTIGEYAKMINGEKWFKEKNLKCSLTVIPCENYTHKTLYELPIKPSPNLPNMSSVYLYPSLCLFEGTPISVGRGTDIPFQVLGHPQIKSDRYFFTPKSVPGAKNPKLLNKKCFGYDLSTYGDVYMKGAKNINLFWLINIYKNFPQKDSFFSKTFTLLSGTKQLQQQIESGKSEEEIKASWQKDLSSFKVIRKKYLLYTDFE